ncbi:hypothetical protein [Cellulomonas hominis]|uniref:hypothetical protein n=1 Tax=Cellulomonas hominis TaxID=156981 RepID=UPI001B95590C|nr:hypothetical protein [Cellulomonas hominis]VTR76223.1 hypothetical protein CHMI_00979 [Cellulomonas hominis]
MPSDSPDRAEWHASLARRDRAAHDRMAQRAAETGEPLLQQRFDAVTAELHVLRAAVSRRDALLREQTEALREREQRLRALEAARLPAPGLIARARRLAGRARRLVGRYVRTGLTQR